MQRERGQESHTVKSLHPPPVPHHLAQDSRVFSSEAPGNVAVLILSLFVLAWEKEGRQSASEGPAPLRPASTHTRPTWWPGLMADPGLVEGYGGPKLPQAFLSFWKVWLPDAHAPSTDRDGQERL